MRPPPAPQSREGATKLVAPDDSAGWVVDGPPRSVELVLADARRLGHEEAVLTSYGVVVRVDASVEWVVAENDLGGPERS